MTTSHLQVTFNLIQDARNVARKLYKAVEVQLITYITLDIVQNNVGSVQETVLLTYKAALTGTPLTPSRRTAREMFREEARNAPGGLHSRPAVTCKPPGGPASNISTSHHLLEDMK